MKVGPGDLATFPMAEARASRILRVEKMGDALYSAISGKVKIPGEKNGF